MVVASHGPPLPIDGSAASALVQLRNKIFFYIYKISMGALLFQACEEA